jgi:hypothetical protein
MQKFVKAKSPRSKMKEKTCFLNYFRTLFEALIFVEK